MLLSYKCTYLWYLFFSGVIYCSIRLLALWRKVRFHVKLYVVVRALEWFRFLFLTCICFFLFVCTSPSFALSFMMLVDYFSCWDASRLNQKGEERSFTRLVLPFIVNLWDRSLAQSHVECSTHLFGPQSPGLCLGIFMLVLASSNNEFNGEFAIEFPAFCVLK